MQAKVRTVAFQGIDVLPVDVQVLVAPGTIAFTVVGLIPFGGSVADQQRSAQAEFDRWGPLIKRIGFTVDS